MKLLRALSYKMLPLLLALALAEEGVPDRNEERTIRGVVATLGPDDAPVYLPGVQVLLRCEKAADKQKPTVTDENGRFSLAGPKSGKCTVTASVYGFRTETKMAAVTENSAVEL